MQWFDLNEITQNTTVRVYTKVNTVDFREIGPMQMVFYPNMASAGDAIALQEVVVGINQDVRVSFQSQTVEAASRTIEYRYIEEFH